MKHSLCIIKKLVSCAFILTGLMFVTFSSNATPVYCNDNGVFETDGGIQNLVDNTPCYVDGGANYSWNAYLPSALVDFNYDIETSGNDKIDEVAHVIAYLTDFGVIENGALFDYYENDNDTSIGSLSELYKYDTGGVQTGTWDLDDWDLDDQLANFMTVKTSTGFKLYTFLDGASSGSWSTEDIGQNMSHITFWSVTGGGFTPQCVEPCGTDVPEPKTLLIFAIALFGLAISRKRFVK